MSAADGARVGGRAARPAAAVALLLAGPFAAACALGTAWAAQGVVARNAFSELGLEHAAAELLQAAVDRGVLLALCAALPLVCLALLARATRRRLALVTAWALGLELVLVAPLAALALGWGARRWRFGHELPGLLWSAERGLWALAALLVPLAALLVAARRTRGRADADVALPGPRLARAAAACLALALAAPLAVHALGLVAPPRAGRTSCTSRGIRCAPIACRPTAARARRRPTSTGWPPRACSSSRRSARTTGRDPPTCRS